MKTSSIENLFHEKRSFQISPPHHRTPWIASLEEFKNQYQKSITNPENFWGKIAEQFEWFQKWNQILNYDWSDDIQVSWFEGGKTNISLNAIDRHLPTRADQVALIWEGNQSGEIKKFTYRQLHQEVCKLANALKKLGIQKGDRVAIYMGMVPELFFSLLACARIGAIHNVIFGGFSVESLRDRILDSKAKILLTADGLLRGKKVVPLKPIADQGMKECEKEGHQVQACLVLRRTNIQIEMKTGRDRWWEELVASQDEDCEPEKMDAEDPLFILYTSGSTGKPKGVLHTTAGYMIHVATTFKYIFDYHDEDIFWCTADIGWVTGHSYLVYGPLLNGATTMMFEGIPTYPSYDRFWEMIDRHRVTQFYTAPTAIRSLMRESDNYVLKHDLSSLRVLGSVGEPINPEAWIWYFKTVGKEKCPIVDTWWQTETGGILVSPIPYATPLKPGSAAFPFFGVKAKVVREDGSECKPNEGGFLVIEKPWPGMIRTVFGQPKRLKETYFSKFPAVYFAGDGARVDEDGYIWFLGRVDDVLKVSGHRIGTAELESAFVQHPSVTEAAVVGFPHEIKGEGIYAFLTLKEGLKPDRNLRRELIQEITHSIGPIAKPDHIQFTPALPKTRSGKIMRRILRKIAAGDTDQIGDVSTLADSDIVKELLIGSRAIREEN